MFLKPCLDCGTLSQRSRCTACYSRSKAHYRGTYAKQAKWVRDNAVACWICKQGASPTDPFVADHLFGGDPLSPLLPAHRSCNAKRANTERYRYQ